jgi:hypothetical protein
MSENLHRLALAASRNPHFLGHRLAVYAQQRGLDEDELCRHLAIGADGLDRLRLCRVWCVLVDVIVYVARVAGGIGCDEAALMEVLQETP